jgi:hypothetical protein
MQVKKEDIAIWLGMINRAMRSLEGGNIQAALEELTHVVGLRKGDARMKAHREGI